MPGVRLPPSRLSGLRAPLRLLLVIAALGALLGCQAKLSVHVTVESNGSGSVEVGVGLDDEAVAKAGDLGSQLRVDDLRAAGWTVTGPPRRTTATRGCGPPSPSTTRPGPWPCSTR